MNKHLYISLILTFLCNLAQAQNAVLASSDAFFNSNFSNSFVCGVAVDAGDDIYLCEGDLPVQLNGSVMGTSTGFSWMSDPNLDDASILNPIVSAAGTYTLTGQGFELNLINNGDFEQGDMGFDSDYIPGNSGAGNYLIAESPEDYISFFSDCSDHTSGSGNMMVVDGSTDNTDNIWCQTVTVNPNTDYIFSFWATMVGSAPLPELFVTIDGTALGTPTVIPSTTCVWNEISNAWNSQSNTSVEICIGNMTEFSFGNDFALDDIFLSADCEASDDVTVFILEAEAVAVDATIPCEGDCIQLNGTGSTTGTGVTYEWTTTNGGTIQDETTLMPTVCEAGTYQLEVSHADPNNTVICTESISITVDLGTPDPLVPTFDGADEVCEGTIEIYTITSTDPNAASYQWQVTGGTISTGQNTNEIEVNWDGTTSGEVCVLADNACGQSAQECLSIVINAAPTTPDISGPTNICSDPIAIYSTTTTTGVNTFTWTVPMGVMIQSGDGTASIEVDWGTVQGGDICLEIINDCGTESDCITVNFGNVQVDINSSDPLCDGESTGFIKVTALSGTAPHTYVWDGGEMVDSIFGLPANTYTVTVTDNDGCSTVEMITLINPSPLSLTLTPAEMSCYDICDGSISTTVSGGTSPYSYAWSNSESSDNLANLCEGTYTVTVSDANGCTIEDQVTLTNPPEITATISQDTTICEGEQVGIEFTFTGVGPYDVELSEGSIFTNISSGDIEFISPTSTTSISITTFSDVGQSGCTGSSTSSILITVNELPDTPIIDGLDQLCEGATATYCITNIANINTFLWTIPADASIITGQGSSCIEVDWTGSLGGDVCVEATNDCGSEQGCLSVTINQSPSSNFSVDPVICIDSTSTITYTGGANSAATFTWDFAGGTVVSGSGSGPYEIQWATAGDQTVTLTVEENGCTSTISSETIDIDGPIPAPVINCTSTVNSITFTWADVPGATSYQVNDLTGTGGMVIGNMYTVTGLTNGQVVTIEVIAMGNSACGNTSVEATCEADDCPTITVDIMHIDPICLENNLTPFDLSVTLTGNTMGTSTWSGDGITDPTLGTFDPIIAGLGLHDITFTYEENGCPYIDVLTIEIFAIPTPDFSVDGNICIIESSTITYQGTGTSAASFIWGFDGGSVISGNGSGPYEISWADTGSYNITLTVEENGCTSNSFSQTVQVDAELIAPVVNCNSSTNSVVFSWDNVDGATNYSITEISGPSGTLNGNSYEVTGLTTGQEVTIELVIEGGGACGNLTIPANCSAQNCPNITVAIDSVASMCFTTSLTAFDLTAVVNGGTMGTSTWSGNGITDTTLGTFDPQIAGAGNHQITFTYEEAGCPFIDVITIEIFETPTAIFMVDGNICITESSTITYQGTGTSAASFIWGFDGGTVISGNGSGPYEISWADSGSYNITLTVEENGCISNSFSQPVQVDTLLIAPDIICNSTTQTVTFSWDAVVGATGYSVNDISGPTGTINGNNYEVTGLTTGQQIDIELVVMGTTSCGDITIPMTCFAQNCPGILVEADGVNAMCFSPSLSPFDLTGTVTGGDSTGVVTWSGDGITNATTGTFDPQVAGVGSHNITFSYDQDNCTFTDVIVIEIFATPTADFTVDENICITASSIITYQGTATAAASFVWNFGGGSIISGNGSGPYEISWADSGSYNITLTVEENNCFSQQLSQTVQVDAPLQEPTINCTSTTQSVTFTWDDVAGASGYSVVVISGPVGTLNGNSYEMNGLSIGQSVEIELTVEGSTACGNIMIPITCSADNCPPISVAIDTVASICLSNDVMPFNMSAVVTGGNNTGDTIWTGDGITDAAIGTFDPQVAGVGTHNITFTYEQDSCNYTDVLSIEIFAIPTSSFAVDGVICLIDSATVTYQGTASPLANYTWDFDGGTILSGNGAGPYDVSWATAGDYNITLTVEENGCISTSSTQPVQVDAELEGLNISCSSTTNTIVFSWDDVAGADTYQVNELSAITGTQNGNTYEFTNLTPGQSVTIEVVAMGSSVCGVTTLEATCSADSCPTIALVLDPIADICMDANTPVIPLNVVVNGSDGSGSGTWSGNGITNEDFDPQIAGEGIHKLIYSFTELQCDFSDSIFVNVVLQPEAIAGDGGHLDCNQTTIILNGANSSTFASPTWTTNTGSFVNGDSTFTPTINAPGTYYLLTENGGCTSLDSLVITQNITTPTADAGLEQLITCDQPCVILGGTNTSAGNTFTYEWTGPNSFSSTEITPEVCIAGQYTLTVLDTENGCFSTTSSVVISEDTTPPIANIEAFGNLDCNTSALVLDGSTSSSGGSFDYQWSNDNGIIPNAQNAIYEASVEGNYYLEVLNNSTGCLAYDTVFVNDIVSYPIAAIAIPEMLTCDTLSVDLDGSASSDFSSIVYDWTGPTGGIQSGNNTNTINVNLPGEYELTVMDMTNGCETSATVFVLQNIVAPSADAGQDIELDCNDISAMLGSENTSSGNSFVYTWTSSNPDGTISDPTALNPVITGLGTYTLMVENIENGCTSVDEIVISQSPDIPQVINFDSFDPLCHGDEDGSIYITSIEGGDGPYVYSLNGNPFNSTNTYQNLPPAAYEITIQDANGCELSTTVTLVEPDSISIDLGENIYLELGDSVQLDPVTTGTFDTLIWETSIPYSNCDNSLPCWNPIFTPTSQVNIVATVMDENGCYDEDHLMIFVEKNRYVYIPNAFNPDGHPENRVFMIYAGKGVVKVNQFQVFGRWGEKIFQANDFQPNDASFGWDGTFKGEKLNPGVFVYFAEIEFSDGLKIIYKGDVTITH